jgi:hypothetical protein
VDGTVALRVRTLSKGVLGGTLHARHGSTRR